MHADTLVCSKKILSPFFAASAQMCFSAAGCNSADAVTAIDADDCCINKDGGLYYLNGNDCRQCISKWLIEQCIFSMYSVRTTIINDTLLQLLDGSRALLKEKKNLVPIMFKVATLKGTERLILWMYL